MPTATIEPEAMLTRLAPSSGASSWDAKTRTLRAVIAAGTGVVRYDFDGKFTEYLDPAGFELPAHVPLLNTHRAGDIADVLGTVTKVERVGGRVEADIRLSRRPEVEAIAADIADGILSGVSVGYQVLAWAEKTDDAENRTKTATKWRLLEVSVVPIPADDKARIRGKHMPTPNTDDNTTAERDERAEHKRRATIYDLGNHFRAANFAAQHVEAGTTVADFRAALIERLAAEGNQHRTDGMIGAYSGNATLDNPRIRAEAMGEAIACRANPSLTPSEQARQFVGLSLPELAREHLRWAGIETRGMSQGQAVAQAFAVRMGGLHTTSDFALVLSSAVGRVLRPAYDATPSGLKPIARRLELADFRARTMIAMSGISGLEKVNEHGEYKRATLKESGESVQLATYGKIFGITRQAIINDDLGAFDTLPRKFGIEASNFEAEQLAALLAANPVMADGTALFHANHGNLAASGAAPSETTLSAARKALRLQTDQAGKLIGVAPRYFVCGPELETDAEKLMAAITPAATADVQPIKLAIAVEPRLAGKGWYVAADPAQIDGIVYAHLAGTNGPELETREGFDVDGLEIKVRLDFGAAWLDWRGWYRNAGA